MLAGGKAAAPPELSMEHTHLGRTGLLVSRLCLGTMNFGPETSEEDSRTMGPAGCTMNRAAPARGCPGESGSSSEAVPR
jgi:hypothetical protein